MQRDLFEQACHTRRVCGPANKQLFCLDGDAARVAVMVAARRQEPKHCARECQGKGKGGARAKAEGETPGVVGCAAGLVQDSYSRTRCSRTRCSRTRCTASDCSRRCNHPSGVLVWDCTRAQCSLDRERRRERAFGSMGVTTPPQDGCHGTTAGCTKHLHAAMAMPHISKDGLSINRKKQTGAMVRRAGRGWAGLGGVGRVCAGVVARCARTRSHPALIEREMVYSNCTGIVDLASVTVRIKLIIN